jgi:4'-phosphopantetheinyl transferase
MTPPIPPGHIHIWLVSLERSAYGEYDWSALLSHEERQRAARLRFDRDRDRYIAAHGILRFVLDSYLPEPSPLIHGPNGKPALACGGLHFSLSHAEEKALIAVSATGELGVDLERVRAAPDAAAIAELCFSASERTALSLLPQSLQAEAFFKCWTRKEAFVKALGDGLSYPLTDLSVTLDEPPRIRELAGDEQAAAQWSVHHLAPEPGYVGAIVTRHSILKVVSMSLSHLLPPAATPVRELFAGR